MTEITDQATRDMLEWARIAVASKGTQEHEPWVTAARYILATVPAPAPTLAERLEYRADMLDNGDPDLAQTIAEMRWEYGVEQATGTAQWFRSRPMAEAHAQVHGCFRLVRRLVGPAEVTE